MNAGQRGEADFRGAKEQLYLYCLLNIATRRC